MTLTAVDKHDWPLVPGARVRADRPYTLSRRPKARRSSEEGDEEAPDLFEAPQAATGERYTPTDECIVLRVVPRPKTGGVAVECRDTVTMGLRTFAPEALTVVRGETAKSRVVRELMEASRERERRAQRKDAAKAAAAEAKAAAAEAKAAKARVGPSGRTRVKPPEEVAQVPEDLSFLD